MKHKIALSIVTGDKHVKVTIENQALANVILEAVGLVIDLDDAEDASYHVISKDHKSSVIAA